MPSEELRLLVINALIKESMANISMCEELGFGDIAGILKITAATLEKVKNLPG